MAATQIERDSLLQEFDRVVLQLTGAGQPIPVDIEEWLGRLLLLYGVPFHYLVPEEDMLPPESIRFFYLDPGWMKCLLEGACSVGRSSTMDDLLDQRLRNHFLDYAGKKAREVRAGQQGDLHWPLSGFLLRSLVVEGWQGLEMKAAGVDGQGNRLDPLEPLRIDRLSPEIMLCIFNGKVTDIDITQPPEGMHFGTAATARVPNAYQKRHLRRLCPKEQAGDFLDNAQVLVTEVPMRPGVQRVIAIQALANQMHSKLNAVQAIDGTDQGRFTAAEFGVQMVESPGKAIFTVTGSGEPL